MRIYIGGAQGVGKTILSARVGELLCWPVFSGSTVLREAAGLHSNEALSALPAQLKDKLRRRTYQGIVDSNEDMVLEGHFWIDPDEIAFFGALVLVTVDPLTLLIRRRGDPTRLRSLRIEEATADLTATEIRARALAKLGFVPLNVVANYDLEATAQKVVDDISQASKLLMTNTSRGAYGTTSRM